MTARDERLARLGAVGGMLKDAALARLREVAGECRRLERELAALDAEARVALADIDVAARAVLDEGRARRYAERRIALNGALARARAEEARQMRAAALAFGRDKALQDLQARLHRR